MKVDVFGVKVDDLTEDQATNLVKSWLKKPGKHLIVTPNPEFIVEAQRNTSFKQVLNQADLAIPDGAGLKLTGKIKHTTTGVDLMDRLCKESVNWGITIGLIGGGDGVAVKTKDCLEKTYPGIKIVYAEQGPSLNNELRIKSNGNDLDYHNSLFLSHHSCDLLFVAFGMVKQELWISQNINKLPVKVAMGVGGSFDYLSGKIKRAPLFLRRLGLEWLFRLINQPWRFSRQLKLLKFLWLIIKS